MSTVAGFARDPEAEVRTRRALQGISDVLNAAILSGDIIQVEGGWQITAAAAIAAAIAAHVAEADPHPQYLLEADYTDPTGLLSVVPASFILAVGAAATVGTNKTTSIPIPFAATIVKAQAYAQTGPTGADLIFDINLNGTSIWGATPANRLEIEDAAQYGIQTAFDSTAVVEGDLLTIDIDQVGSTTAGQDITVVLSLRMGLE
jgi:hypothetical protein